MSLGKGMKFGNSWVLSRGKVRIGCTPDVVKNPTWESGHEAPGRKEGEKKRFPKRAYKGVTHSIITLVGKRGQGGGHGKKTGSELGKEFQGKNWYTKKGKT